MGKPEDLAAAVAHDLAEPLRVIAHYADRLPDPSDPETEEAVAAIRSAVVRMRDLLESLRDYARSGHRRLVRAPTDLDAVLDRALANLEVAVAERGAHVEREPLPTLEVDGVQLVRVFQNLIDNALKFASEERVARIRVGASCEGPVWCFSVSDNGVGFDTDAAGRIFGLFERAHSQAEYPGTGTGLAICSRLIELHGGRIWAESKPGEGSTFSFTLPAT